jgi:hypothetical protein
MTLPQLVNEVVTFFNTLKYDTNIRTKDNIKKYKGDYLCMHY